MDDVFVLSAVRTPVGRFGGALSSVRPDDLLAEVLAGASARSGLVPDEIEEVVVGLVNGSGEAMGNVARYSALLAGLPASTAGMTLNRFCGSGLAALNTLAHSIMVGSVTGGIAAGVESMSRSTWPIRKPVSGRHIGPVVGGRDAMFSGAGGPQHPLLEANGTMIEMAHAAQRTADELGIPRERMDRYAAESHAKARAADAEGRFDDELMRLAHDGSFVRDESVRETSVALLSKLEPYDPSAPDMTAGNASPINDGASAIVLAGRRTSAPMRPLARVAGTAVAAVPPEQFAIAPVPAVRRLLDRAGVALESVDLFEINEAFAVQAIACIDLLGLDPGRVNVNGGGLALGHALGNSGTRIAVTLVHEMRRRRSRYGVAAMCIAAGQGIATLFERVDAR